MEAVGISSSQKVGDNRIITLHSLSGWYVDGRLRKCPQRYATVQYRQILQSVVHERL